MARPALVAPDSFKGTLSASDVATAVAAGVRDAGAEAVELPVADGGEGTLEVLVNALGGEYRSATVRDPLHRPVAASFGLLPDGRGVVEMAQASGLSLVAEDERDPWNASTYGAGELIAAATAAGASTVIVAVGGSATTDGGAGAIEALEDAGVQPTLEVVCDVDTTWEDAPRVFGPQKGADPDTVARLERRLDELAARAPRDPRGLPMTGCAGGLSGGLYAFCGATLVPGAAYVLDAIGFDQQARRSGIVVTGEGRLDSQTLSGKLVSEVAARCARARVACHAVVGERDLDADSQRRLRLASVREASTLEELRAAGRELIRSLPR
jgi:glycerate kinase